MSRILPRGIRFSWAGLFLFLFMAVLLALGDASIRSACAVREGPVHDLYLLQLQRWIPAGLAFYVALAAIPYRKLVDFSVIPYLAAVACLVLVLIPGIGTERFHARRWLFGFQPSEFAKLAVLLASAFLISATQLEKSSSKLAAVAIAVAAPLGLIICQPDLGTAIVLVPVVGSMLFVAGTAPRFLAWTTLSVFAAAALFLGAILVPERMPKDSPLRARIESVTSRVIFPHWKKRILVFADPDNFDPLGAGWNCRQSKIAVGSGGLWGKGYLNGTQNVLGFLPRAVSSTDFIFSVYAEECGFAGSLLLLGLYAGLFASIAVIGIQCADTTGRLLAAGVLTLFGFHVFVNIAMTVGRVPITGLPLPLISYGGSFTISTMAMLGLVQSVALHGRPPAKSTNP